MRNTRVLKIRGYSCHLACVCTVSLVFKKYEPQISVAEDRCILSFDSINDNEMKYRIEATWSLTLDS